MHQSRDHPLDGCRRFLLNLVGMHAAKWMRHNDNTGFRQTESLGLDARRQFKHVCTYDGARYAAFLKLY